MRMLRQSLCCEDCKATCEEEFKKILDLHNSGLVIYRHKPKNSMAQSRKTEVLKNEYYILHNTNSADLNRPMFMFELSQYKTKCILCKINIQKVRSLLDEITAIRGKEILSKCRYCKKSNPAGKCMRCDYIVNKFLTIKMKQCDDRENRFERWLFKVRLFLESLTKAGYVCKHKTNEEGPIKDFEKLLKQLEAPITMRNLDIRLFPAESDVMNVLLENKVMLHEIITNLQTESFSKQHISYDSLYESPSQIARSCVCKYFSDKNNQEDFITNASSTHEPLKSKIVTQRSTEKTVIDLNPPKELHSQETPPKSSNTKKSQIIKKSNEITRDSKVEERKSKQNKENIKLKKPIEKSPNVEKPNKHIITSEEQLLLKMMKEREKERKKLNSTIKPEKMKSLPKIEDLPKLKIHSNHELTEESSENVIECGDQQTLYPTEMVKGKNIVPLHFNNKIVDNDSAKPLFFKVQPNLADVVSSPFPPQPPTSVVTNGDDKLKKNVSDYTHTNDKATKGIIRYELSNREFIDKGWTKLPIKKIMRRMNIYKMTSANSKFDWFENNKFKKLMFYGTGEKLAEIEENGCGRWYYKNGNIALNYYKAKELNAGQRYIIYSSGDENDNGKRTPITVLACFDFLGNGVVYDHYGNIRLKYNQSEGMVIDEKIAPPGRWKWHTLNEPPILQPVFINTYDNDSNPYLQELLNENKDCALSKRAVNPEMLTIELEQFVREKANKLLQKFKPFQIRMKVLKINEQFSLRVIDQANIYVLFRDGRVSLKLNLGMLLLSDEIIDTETAEVSQVATPYDRHPPKSESMASIQNTLNRAKKMGRKRGVLEFPPLPPFVQKNQREDFM